MALPNSNTSTAVLGSGLQPLNYLIAGQERERQRQFRQQQLSEYKKTQRDRSIKEWMDIDPIETWAPATGEVNSALQNVRNFTLQSLMQNPRAYSDPNFMSKRNELLLNVDTLAKKNKHYESVWTKANDLISKGTFYDSDKASRALNDVFYDEDKNYRGSDNIDISKVEQILSSPEYFNESKVIKDFKDNLPKLSTSYSQLITDEYGDKRMKNVDIKRDIFSDRIGKDGLPLIKINDTTLAVAMQHPGVSKYLQNSPNPKETLAKMLAGWGEYDVKSSIGGTVSGGSGSGEEADKKKQELARRKLLNDITVNKDNTALQNLTSIVEGFGADFGYPMGPPKDGFSNAEPDRIIITFPPVKISGSGEIPGGKKEIWIRTPEEEEAARGIINNLLNEWQPTSGKIGTDRLYAADEEAFNEDPASLRERDPYGVMIPFAPKK